LSFIQPGFKKLLIKCDIIRIIGYNWTNGQKDIESINYCVKGFLFTDPIKARKMKINYRISAKADPVFWNLIFRG
jgi:hypothetical protein